MIHRAAIGPLVVTIAFLWLLPAWGQSGPPGKPPIAQQVEIQRGKLKKIDLEKRVVTITQKDKDLSFELTEQTRLLGTRGQTQAEQLTGFRPGLEIEFIARAQGGKPQLVGMRIAQTEGTGPRQRVSPEHGSLKPLTELGAAKYHGFSGGLYPNSKNERPTEHEAAGQRLARQVEPLNAEGKPDPAGKIVLLSLGMSNASQISEGFQRQLQAAKGINPRLHFVNGAQGGMVAEVIQNPKDGGRGEQYWRVVDERLAKASITRAQVQAVWIKQADGGPTQGFPQYPQKLQRELKKIVQLVAERFPNARLCYLSSRTYGGYATTMLNPEPVAYESGFAVKWLIEEQLHGNADLLYDSSKGKVTSPWLSWGPYLWANGAAKRADGFSYAPDDFVADGTHHAASGMRKTSELLLKFFEADSTTRPWFMGQP